MPETEMKKVAFLSMNSLANYVCYDNLLFAPLLATGWEAETVSWRDSTIDWDNYSAVLVRSCWDYQADPETFLRALETIEKSSAQLENPLQLIRWNLDKKYLRELEQAGVTIVPSTWMTGFSSADILASFEDFDTNEIVLKPNISANAENTFRLNKQQFLDSAAALQKTFFQRDFMLQPFIKNIVKEGEFSLFFFGSEYSHTILKKPKHKDFRVQEEHGGVLTTIEAEPDLLACARQVLATLSPQPLYSRVDFVRTPTGFALMELELIEPSLYFNMDPTSPARFVRAFNQWMQQ